MKRVRSEALWRFLNEKGVLDGTEAEIQAAKREYRKLYKKAWKQQKLKQRELRPGFTLKEYDLIQTAAKRAGLKPTTFARETILSNATHTDFIPNKPVLLKVLQYISITAIELSKRGTEKQILEPIETAERMFLQYLFSHDPENPDPP